MVIEFRINDHYDRRADDVDPSMIILHYTQTKDFQALDDIFMGRNVVPEVGRVSAHYVVDVNGHVVQYVEEKHRAWHAGRSYWGGMRDINSHSFGVEIVHPGHDHIEEGYPFEQIEGVIEVCRHLVYEYSIKPWNILAHSDVAPDRKIDPGEFFPWQRVADYGVGIWPDEDNADAGTAEFLLGNPDGLKSHFASYGYDPDLPLDVIVMAFQRHFEPTVFYGDGSPGQPTVRTVKRLLALSAVKGR